MKNIIIAVLLLGTLAGSSLLGQSENHKWKTLLTGTRFVWYDGPQLDTVSASRFDIWTIELHKPPIDIDGIEGKIVRTKTLFCVDRESAKYGLKKVVYYDKVNTELGRYSYETDDTVPESKYYFPILNNPLFEALFKELDRKQGKAQ